MIKYKYIQTLIISMDRAKQLENYLENNITLSFCQPDPDHNCKEIHLPIDRNDEKIKI